VRENWENQKSIGDSSQQRDKKKACNTIYFLSKKKKKKKKKKRISRKKKTQQESDSAWMINKNIPSLSLLFYLVNLRNVEGWRLFILEKKTKNAFYFCF
jgi:hypothetical protein